MDFRDDYILAQFCRRFWSKLTELLLISKIKGKKKHFVAKNFLILTVSDDIYSTIKKHIIVEIR